ncbi:GDP-mannose 4,6-dehydratase [Thiomicrorhabdus sp.]|uniref:GDP-mannose 4,6-dehydratase n=1 Tax=Thiomicrorhabdus sp. TaxID=2039724 RepID=UPI0029C87D32|nr:GDP-mannose 4,6-dehydratase [Thiomicrorhabdus sp.]
MNFNKIVITGAAGFIGSHVYDHFRNEYPNAEIIIVDKMTYAADIRNIPDVLTNPKHKLMVGDLIDLKICLDATENADLVLNLAAESHVDNSFNNSIIFTTSNTLGTHTLMEACKRNGVKRIVHISTDEVYGENINDSFKENDELNPTNPYSASKAGAEMIVKSYFKSFKIPVTTVRANNIYGIRQFPEKVIPKFSLRALNNLPLQIHGNGSNLRHYLAAQDFAKALQIVALEGNLGESYNIASDIELSNLEMANLINSIVRPDNNDIEFINNRPFNDSRYAVNDDKIRSLGWQPERSVIEDMPKIVNWYKENEFRYPNIIF